mmetsp:Transcript_31392/g.56885  ORF Transcript_31392/g.56885 Transcript_31392/m.56885 type:complete len:223 (+) Transcript_31392:635-1303(+)
MMDRNPQSRYTGKRLSSLKSTPKPTHPNVSQRRVFFGSASNASPDPSTRSPSSSAVARSSVCLCLFLNDFQAVCHFASSILSSANLRLISLISFILMRRLTMSATSTADLHCSMSSSSLATRKGLLAGSIEHSAKMSSHMQTKFRTASSNAEVFSCLFSFGAMFCNARLQSRLFASRLRSAKVTCASRDCPSTASSSLTVSSKSFAMSSFRCLISACFSTNS